MHVPAIMHRGAGGYTLIEMTILVAILGIIAVPAAVFFSSHLKNVTTSQNKVIAQENLRQALAVIEPILMEANEIVQVSSTAVTVTLDSCNMASYQMQGDADGDGIPNIQDPDDDNDAAGALTQPATAQWAVGYDLNDDDDDGDGQVDLRVSISRSGDQLIKAVSVNGGAWQADTVLEQVVYFAITPYGSKREDLGKNIDRGNDGAASTGDSGENDGSISAREIDWVQPPAGHGNRSGALDTAQERKYIISLYLEVGVDKNRDGVEDYRVRTEIAPPLLAVKGKM